ncbi:MAG: site-2 protease family protein [Actinobacteria bacterium]|nr:site-2 protease family protein [Actinomycetota bacterium]
MSSGVAIAIFVIGIIGAIMLHEWGHFWTARRFGMRADRFFLGFGPTLWSTHRGETEYGVKALPLGGFVRIRGMAESDQRLGPVATDVLDRDVVAEERRAVAQRENRELLEVPAVPAPTWDRLRAELAGRGTPQATIERIVDRTRATAGDDASVDEVRQVLTEVVTTEVPDTGRHGDLLHRLLEGDRGRFFPDRPAWQRAIVLVAGSTMHFLIAVVLLFVGFAMLPQPTAAPVVDGFTEDSVGAEQGLEEGDRLVSVAGVSSDDFQALREAIREHPGEPVPVVVERNGEQVRLTLTPAAGEDPDTGETVGQLGFFPRVVEERLPIGDALYETFVGEASFSALTVGTVQSLGRVFGPEGIGAIFAQVGGTQERDPAGAVSLPGVVGLAGEGTAMFGPLFLLLILANINIFIGIFNLLPLPPLDGGHLAVLGIERGVNGVRRRMGRPDDFTVDPRAVAAVAVPVIVIIGTVSLALVWLDITNPIRLQ